MDFYAKKTPASRAEIFFQANYTSQFLTHLNYAKDPGKLDSVLSKFITTRT